MPPPRARDGRVLEHGISGFPLYFTRKGQPTIITSDIWAYLEYVSRRRLPPDRAKSAVAYVDQAFEFFEAASNPRVSSRPLLYYYSFLNLAKVLLLHKGVKFPPLVYHGLADPRTNVKTRITLAGQKVVAHAPDQKGQNLFPEFVRVLDGNVSKLPRSYRVVDLLAQVPGIHRTYCSALDSKPRFCPIRGIEILKSGTEYWVRIRLERDDPDVKPTASDIVGTGGFCRAFHCVISQTKGETWFESQPQIGVRRGVDTAIRKLRDDVLGCGVWTILTAQGSRYYFGAFRRSVVLPHLASIYAVMFYLGSLTRYKPYDFDSIVTKGYAWLVSEFLETQPSQFAYGLASKIAGANVVLPYAAAPLG